MRGVLRRVARPFAESILQWYPLRTERTVTEVLKSLASYDLDALREEVARARARQDFSEGLYGHCISLPAAGDLAVEYRTHHNNVPFSGALAQCQTMRGIFDSLKTEKASFRLLRRAPHTAYGIHDDVDKGVDILRFQIPIITNPDAFIVAQKDGVSLDGLAERVNEIRESGDLRFDFARFTLAFGQWFDLFSLAPGSMYRFDTNQLHTAINAGNHERIVLGIDILANDWVKDWIPREFTVSFPPTPADALSEASWEWTSLEHGLITNPVTADA